MKQPVSEGQAKQHVAGMKTTFQVNNCLEHLLQLQSRTVRQEVLHVDFACPALLALHPHTQRLCTALPKCHQ